MFFKHSVNFICATIFLAAAGRVLGQYEITWHTVDGGGVLNSTNGQPGGFELSGTIGQHDAQVPPVMTGAGFELAGGFWPVTQVCYCPGDLTGDGTKDGRDVQLFIACLLSGGNCSCADADAADGVNFDDVPVFVNDLLAGPGCP